MCSFHNPKVFGLEVFLYSRQPHCLVDCNMVSMKKRKSNNCALGTDRHLEDGVQSHQINFFYYSLNKLLDLPVLLIEQTEIVEHFKLNTKFVFEDTEDYFCLCKLVVSQPWLVCILTGCFNKTDLVVHDNFFEFFLHILFQSWVKAALDCFRHHSVKVHGAHVDRVQLLLPLFSHRNCQHPAGNIKRIFIHRFSGFSVKSDGVEHIFIFSDFWQVRQVNLSVWVYSEVSRLQVGHLKHLHDWMRHNVDFFVESPHSLRCLDCLSAWWKPPYKVYWLHLI